MTSGRARGHALRARARRGRRVLRGRSRRRPPTDEALVMRQAFGGMLWCKQFYHYDVRALAGRRPDPDRRRRASRLHGRNADWAHVDNRDVISMPDKWEYPWYAAWDLAFHCDHAQPRRSRVRQGAAAPDHARVVHEPQRPAARLRVELRRRQPAGARARRADGVPQRRRHATATWLERIFHKLLLGFTWWANVKDPERR